MATKIKKGILKRIGFDTFKDIQGLTDIKVRIINSLTGVLIEGCETILTELPLDPAELTFKQGEVISDIALKSNSIKVSELTAAKFATGDIVDIVDSTDRVVFKTTKVQSIDYAAGTITLEGEAILQTLIADEVKIKIANKTGTYTGEIQIPTETGTYFVWISSQSANKNYNYGMIEVVENDINDLMSKIESVKQVVTGSSSSVWGTIQI